MSAVSSTLLGRTRWIEGLLAELQFELWIGDAAEIRTKRPRGSWCKPIFVNLGLRDAVVIVSKPWLLWTWVCFQTPRVDGVSDSNEAPTLFDGYFSGYLSGSDMRRTPPSSNKHDTAKNTIKPKK